MDGTAKTAARNARSEIGKEHGLVSLSFVNMHLSLPNHIQVIEAILTVLE